MAVFVQPFSSFSKNDYFSPPLDSLHSWVLSSRSEVLAYYISSFHTVEKNLVGSNMHIWPTMVVFDHSLGWFILVYLSFLKTNLHILTLCFSGLLDFTLSLYCRGTVLPFLQNYFTNLKSGRQSKDARSQKKTTVFCSKGASRSKKNALFYIRCKLSLLPSAVILQPTTLVWVQRKGWNLLSLGVNM